MDKIIFSILKTIYIFSIVLILESCVDDEKHKIFDQTVGTYKVDFSISDTTFTKKEKSYYKNSELSLNKDGTFNFSSLVPMNHGTSGEWEIIGNEIERRIRLNYCWGNEDIDICDRENCVLFIAIPRYTDNLIDGFRNLAYRKK